MKLVRSGSSDFRKNDYRLNSHCKPESLKDDDSGLRFIQRNPRNRVLG